MKRLLLDVDGVIANFIKLYVDCAVSAGVVSFNKYHELWYPDSWQISKALKLGPEAVKRVHKYLDVPGVGFNIKPYPDAIEWVKKLDGISDIYFVTAPLDSNPTWCYDRQQWLIKYFGETLGKKLILTSHKYTVNGDIFVDDKVSNLTDWKKYWPNGYTVLWDVQYNKLFKTKTDMFTNSWNELYNMVESL